MIVFFVGTPGSGKTYEAVQKIIDNLRLGRVVCTNIDGMDLHENQQYIKIFLGMDDYTFGTKFRFLSPDDVQRFWKTETILSPKLQYDEHSDIFEDLVIESEELICPQGSLIVLDEVHKFFNARDWNKTDSSGKNINKELSDWASTHRHLGYDLVLITQDIEKVEKQVRSLTEWCFFFRKVNFFGSAVSKKYLCYSYSGDDHRGKPLSKNVRTYRPDIFKCYKSYSASDAKEVGFMSTVNILKHPIFYAIPAVLCLTLYMFFTKSSFASGDVFGTSKVQHKYDNLVSAGKNQSSMKTPSIPQTQPPQPLVSTAVAVVPAAQAVPLIPVALVPVYTQLKVDAFIISAGQTVLQINGITVKLPSPYVKRFVQSTGFAIVDSDYFAIHTSKPTLDPAV